MLRKATLEVLEQLKTLVISVGDHYSKAQVCGTSSIGRHVRHMLDHFVAVELSVHNGHVNYNHRNRDNATEQKAEAALEQIDKLMLWIRTTRFEDYDLTLESEVSMNHCQNAVVGSSFHREICYVIHHTVHHIAYAALLARQAGLTLDPSLGVAPATATCLRNNNSPANALSGIVRLQKSVETGLETVN